MWGPLVFGERSRASYFTDSFIFLLFWVPEACPSCSVVVYEAMVVCTIYTCKFILVGDFILLELCLLWTEGTGNQSSHNDNIMEMRDSRPVGLSHQVFKVSFFYSLYSNKRQLKGSSSISLPIQQAYVIFETPVYHKAEIWKVRIPFHDLSVQIDHHLFKSSQAIDWSNAILLAQVIQNISCDIKDRALLYHSYLSLLVQAFQIPIADKRCIR